MDRQGPQIKIVRGQIFRWLLSGTLDLLGTQSRGDHRPHLGSDSILQLEDAIELALETVAPDLSAVGRIGELRGDADSVALFANAAHERIAYAEFGSDLSDVNGAALVRERGAASDHEQPGQAAERDGDVLHHAVDEIVLTGIAAEVGEGEYDDRGLVG